MTDADGNSALHLAAASNALSSLQLLLRHFHHSSCDDKKWFRKLINQRNRYGYTALLIAGEEGCTGCCAALIKEGCADATLPLLEMPFFTATDLAIRNGHHEVVDVLRRHAY